MVFSFGSAVMRCPCVLLLCLRPSTACVCRFTLRANSGIWCTTCVYYSSCVCVGVGWPPAGCIRWDCLLGEYRIFHTVWAAWAVMYLWCIHLIVLIKVQPDYVRSQSTTRQWNFRIPSDGADRSHSTCTLLSVGLGSPVNVKCQSSSANNLTRRKVTSSFEVI